MPRSSALVIISMFITYRLELKLEKDIFLSALRGYRNSYLLSVLFLAYIFSMESLLYL